MKKWFFVLCVVVLLSCCQGGKWESVHTGVLKSVEFTITKHWFEGVYTKVKITFEDGFVATLSYDIREYPINQECSLLKNRYDYKLVSRSSR